MFVGLEAGMVASNRQKCALAHDAGSVGVMQKRRTCTVHAVVSVAQEGVRIIGVVVTVAVVYVTVAVIVNAVVTNLSFVKPAIDLVR